MDEIPTTIYRPAIVVGDSQSGETEKFDGPYYILRTIARSIERGGPIPQIGSPKSPFNVVPVDFIVKALVAGSRDPAAVGETLPPRRPRPGQRRRAQPAAQPRVRRARADAQGPRQDARAVAQGQARPRLLLRRPVGVDPLPQPPGPVRHPPGDRSCSRATACGARASPSTSTRWSASSARRSTTRRSCRPRSEPGAARRPARRSVTPASRRARPQPPLRPQQLTLDGPHRRARSAPRSRRTSAPRHASTRTAAGDGRGRR